MCGAREDADRDRRPRRSGIAQAQGRTQSCYAPDVSEWQRCTRKAVKGCGEDAVQKDLQTFCSGAQRCSFWRAETDGDTRADRLLI